VHNHDFYKICDNNYLPSLACIYSANKNEQQGCCHLSKRKIFFETEVYL
jgi:hypothetical protein